MSKAVNKRWKKILIGTTLTFTLITGGLLLFLSKNSPGSLDSYKDSDSKNQLMEKKKVMIGGIEQGLFIVGQNQENPVLLFLHGGPGNPEYAMSKESFTELEKMYTVCYWDQRGAGMSYTDLEKNPVDLDQMIEDTLEVTNYLKERFGQEKIYLMGHSWGSFLGMKTIQKQPEDYQAYIGIGQVVNQKESEKIAYDFMLKNANETNDTKAIQSLEKETPETSNFPSTEYIMSTRSELLNKFGGGNAHKDGRKMLEESYQNLLFFKGYTIGEKIDFLKGLQGSLEHLFNYTLVEDLNKTTANVSVPVYILQGKYDYVTSYKLVQEYYEKLEAPKKDMFVFDSSAHQPHNEENEKFNKIMKEIKLMNP
ncbi:alpha/beta fold hydrolase [Enterococcus ureasiticus]|nr:alpha/beta hydrolase [Enterococcus ureasiticus]